MTDPKPTLPSAKPEVGGAKFKWTMSECAAQELWEKTGLLLTTDQKRIIQSNHDYLAKSIAAKAAEKAADEIDDTFDAIERGASIPFGVEEVVAIIQKCFDTEIEREQ